MISLSPLLLHPIQPAPLIIAQISIPVPLRNITCRCTPFPAPTIEHNLLFFTRFIESVFGLERISTEMQGVRDDGEREVDGGWDRALDNFVRFSYIY